MFRNDPRDPDEQGLYECVSCERRIRADHYPVVCERCGGPLQNIGIPRGE